jgi:phosphatidylglycerophosphate synthase
MEPTRRPISSRNSRWAVAVASALARKGIRPNVISVASTLFAALAGAGLWFAGERHEDVVPWLFISAAMLMQLRLLCNLFDGMVAIEGGVKTRSGEIFNELPDRFSDAFILIGAGYSTPPSDWMPLLGWLGAVLAVLTAYVRALGASAGAAQQFCGPMAKQNRMAVLTLGCLISAAFAWLDIKFVLMPWALGLVVIGCVATVFRRAHRIIQELEKR